MLPLRSRRSRTLLMSNRSYFASRTPSATFAKSQKTAMFMVSVGVLMRVYPTRMTCSPNGRRIALSCALGFALAAAPAFAFKLEAWGSAHPEPPKGADRQTLGFMRLFNQDVHERITRRVYDLAGEKAPEDVVAGVRWNDNPPALQASALFGGCMGRQLALGEGMRCWTGMFRVDRLALEVLTKREKTLEPVRSHFGDMQFLHAMAVRAGEPAARTRLNILRWSEFAYRAARGEIEPGANIFEMKRCETPLEKETAQWLAGLFQGPSKQLWTLGGKFPPQSRRLPLVA